MGYDWLYIEMLLREKRFIFNGKVIGVISESHDDFYNTVKQYYPGGQIYKSSHYFVNGYMFHSILHSSDLKGDLTDIIQTSISILNPFYDDIHLKINMDYGYYKMWGYKDTPGRIFEPTKFKYMKI
jgi:hypothetical protein